MPRVLGLAVPPAYTQMLPIVPSESSLRDVPPTMTTLPRGDAASPTAHRSPVSSVWSPSSGAHRTGSSHVLHTTDIADLLHAYSSQEFLEILSLPSRDEVGLEQNRVALTLRMCKAKQLRAGVTQHPPLQRHGSCGAPQPEGLHGCYK